MTGLCQLHSTLSCSVGVNQVRVPLNQYDDLPSTFDAMHPTSYLDARCRRALPGARLKAGSQVVVVRGAGSSGSSSSAGGSSGSSAQSAMSLPQELYGARGEVLGSSSGSSGAALRYDVCIQGGHQLAGEVVGLPPTQLMALVEDAEVPVADDLVVLHGLVKQPELNGRVGLVVKDPFMSAAGGIGATEPDLDQRCVFLQ